jgi:RNA polymerase sigma-70 factor (ECF subfamily)
MFVDPPRPCVEQAARPRTESMGHPDAELMRRWRCGDAAAFAALVERWQQPVARFLARLAGPDRAADLCQEVFLRVLRAAPRYRETGRFSTWLFQIAVNVARDAGRRSRHTPAPLPDVDSSGRSCSRLAGAPDELCERRELARAVACAVAELPPPLREVLALRHDQGMSFEAMARVLGTPASTLKSRFAAALHRLRDRLHELGWSFEETAP